MPKIIAPFCIATLIATVPAAAATYTYTVETGPLHCVLEGNEPCGDAKWLQHEFILDEDQVPGGTLVNAALSLTLWPYEGYVLPEWTEELWGVGEGEELFYLDFYMTTGAAREIVSLSMAILYLGETGWYVSHGDGLTRGRIYSNCEEISECTRWETQDAAQVAAAPIPAALPLLLAALGGLWMIGARRRRA